MLPKYRCHDAVCHAVSRLFFCVFLVSSFVLSISLPCVISVPLYLH